MTDLQEKVSFPSVSRRRFVFSSVGAGFVIPLVFSGCGASDPPTVPTGPEDNASLVEWSAEDLALNAELFPAGLHVGAMRLDSAIFWTYCTDDAAKRLKIWREAEEPGFVYLAFDVEVEPVEGYVKYEIVGLAAATRYSYAFTTENGEVRSDIASFKMPHAEDSLEPVTIAATTCTNYNRMPYKSLILTGKKDFDVFCQLGDMTYNDGAMTKTEFRERWLTTLADPGYLAVMQKAGIYATMDDHEISDDSDRYGLPEDVYETGKTCFFEALAVPQVQAGRLWDSFRWGQTVEFFVLDCRTERDPTSTFSENQVYISRAQMDWLKQGLIDSPCMFKVIFSSVPIMGFTDVWPELLDRWQAFPDQRAEVLDHITDNGIEQVFFLTGDYHMAYCGRVEKEGAASSIWEIMVGPGAPRVPNPLMGVLEVDPSAAPEFFPEGQYDYYSNRPAATLVTFDPGTKSAHVTYYDHETEEVLFDGQLQSLFAEAGKP